MVFWVGLCLITFLTSTIWSGNIGWQHLAHTGLLGITGLTLSLPLHWIYSQIWNLSNRTRFTISLVAVATVAAVWTVLRILTYIWITEEQQSWSDFGGWYFSAIFVFLCWSSLYHGISYFHLAQSEHKKIEAAEAAMVKEQVRRLNAESDAKDAQLKMLRYQLNPHFLFNTLNAINSLVQAKQADRAQKTIVQLSKFLRYSLDNNPEMRITVEREIAALNLYLEIEKTRFADRLRLDFKIDEETRSALIPSLLLQPLIENSMKYAVAKNENGGTIRLQTHLRDNMLVLELSDTGASEKLQSSKIGRGSGRGIGLRNTTDRLKAFYDTNYSFDLQISSSGGLKTIIAIPFELSSEPSPHGKTMESPR